MADKCVACGEVAEGKPLYKKLGSSDCQVEVFTALHEMQLLSLPPEEKNNHYICWDCDETIAEEYATFVSTEAKKKAIEAKRKKQDEVCKLKLQKKLKQAFKKAHIDSLKASGAAGPVSKYKMKEKEREENRYYASHCLMCKCSFEASKSRGYQRFTLNKMVDDESDVADVLKKFGVQVNVTEEQKRKRHICCQCYNKVRRNYKARSRGEAQSSLPIQIQQGGDQMDVFKRRPTTEEHAAEIAKLIPPSLANLYKVVTKEDGSKTTRMNRKTETEKSPRKRRKKNEKVKKNKSVSSSSSSSASDDSSSDSSDNSSSSSSDYSTESSSDTEDGENITVKESPSKKKSNIPIDKKQKHQSNIKIKSPIKSNLSKSNVNVIPKCSDIPKTPTIRTLLPKGANEHGSCDSDVATPVFMSSKDTEIIDFGICNLCGLGYNSRPKEFWYKLSHFLPSVMGVTILNALQILDSELAEVSASVRGKELVCKPCFSRVCKGFRSQILRKIAEKKGIDVDKLELSKIKVKMVDAALEGNAGDGSKDKNKVNGTINDKNKAPSPEHKANDSKTTTHEIKDNAPKPKSVKQSLECSKSVSKKEKVSLKNPNSENPKPSSDHSSNEIKSPPEKEKLNTSKEKIKEEKLNGDIHKYPHGQSTDSKTEIKLTKSTKHIESIPIKNKMFKFKRCPTSFSKLLTTTKSDLELINLINESRHLRYKGNIVLLHGVIVEIADLKGILPKSVIKDKEPVQLEFYSDIYQFTNYRRNLKNKNTWSHCILCQKEGLGVDITTLWLEDPVAPPNLMVPLRWAQLSLDPDVNLSCEDGKVCEDCHNSLKNKFGKFVGSRVALSHGLDSQKIALDKYKVSFDSIAMNIVADPLKKRKKERVLGEKPPETETVLPQEKVLKAEPSPKSAETMNKSCDNAEAGVDKDQENSKDYPSLPSEKNQESIKSKKLISENESHSDTQGNDHLDSESQKLRDNVSLDLQLSDSDSEEESNLNRIPPSSEPSKEMNKSNLDAKETCQNSVEKSIVTNVEGESSKTLYNGDDVRENDKLKDDDKTVNEDKGVNYDSPQHQNSINERHNDPMLDTDVSSEGNPGELSAIEPNKLKGIRSKLTSQATLDKDEISKDSSNLDSELDDSRNLNTGLKGSCNFDAETEALSKDETSHSVSEEIENDVGKINNNSTERNGDKINLVEKECVKEAFEKVMSKNSDCELNGSSKESRCLESKDKGTDNQDKKMKSSKAVEQKNRIIKTRDGEIVICQTYEDEANDNIKEELEDRDDVDDTIINGIGKLNSSKSSDVGSNDSGHKDGESNELNALEGSNDDLTPESEESNYSSHSENEKEMRTDAVDEKTLENSGVENFSRPKIVLVDICNLKNTLTSNSTDNVAKVSPTPKNKLNGSNNTQSTGEELPLNVVSLTHDYKNPKENGEGEEENLTHNYNNATGNTEENEELNTSESIKDKREITNNNKRKFSEIDASSGENESKTKYLKANDYLEDTRNRDKGLESEIPEKPKNLASQQEEHSEQPLDNPTSCPSKDISTAKRKVSYKNDGTLCLSSTFSELGESFADNGDNLENEYGENSVAPFAQRKRFKGRNANSNRQSMSEEEMLPRCIDDVWQTVQGINLDDLICLEIDYPLRLCQWNVGFLLALNDLRVHLGASLENLMLWLKRLLPLELRIKSMEPSIEKFSNYLLSLNNSQEKASSKFYKEILPDSLFISSTTINNKNVHKQRSSLKFYIEDVGDKSFKSNGVHWEDFLSPVNMDNLLAGKPSRVSWSDFNNGLLYALWKVNNLIGGDTQNFITWLSLTSTTVMKEKNYLAMSKAAAAIDKHLQEYPDEVSRLDAPIVVRPGGSSSGSNPDHGKEAGPSRSVDSINSSDLKDKRNSENDTDVINKDGQNSNSKVKSLSQNSDLAKIVSCKKTARVLPQPPNIGVLVTDKNGSSNLPPKGSNAVSSSEPVLPVNMNTNQEVLPQSQHSESNPYCNNNNNVSLINNSNSLNDKLLFGSVNAFESSDLNLTSKRNSSSHSLTQMRQINLNGIQSTDNLLTSVKGSQVCGSSNPSEFNSTIKIPRASEPKLHVSTRPPFSPSVNSVGGLPLIPILNSSGVMTMVPLPMKMASPINPQFSVSRPSINDSNQPRLVQQIVTPTQIQSQGVAGTPSVGNEQELASKVNNLERQLQEIQKQNSQLLEMNQKLLEKTLQDKTANCSSSQDEIIIDDDLPNSSIQSLNPEPSLKIGGPFSVKAKVGKSSSSARKNVITRHSLTNSKKHRVHIGSKSSYNK